MLERSRLTSFGPSTVNGTIASSTVTEAIVIGSACGFVTRILISPGSELDPADVEDVGRRRVAPDQIDERGAGGDERADDDGEQEDRPERPEPPRVASPEDVSARLAISR